MKKKVFVIENEWTVRRKIHDRIHGKTFGGCSKIDTQQADQIIDEMFAVLADYELKDVVGFEATVQKIDWYALDEKRTLSVIVNPPNVKPGDKLQVWFVVEKKKLPSFADMKGIFRKKEESDEG